VLIAAIVLAVGAAIGVIVAAMLRQPTPADAPVAIVAIPAPAADGPECAKLSAALPQRLGDFERAPVAEPAPAGTAAWRASTDGEPVILRCGVDRPLEFVAGSPLQAVDDVAWFRVADPATGDRPGGRTTWFVVDRPVYVALTLPPGSGPTPIQEISRVVAESLPAKDVDPAPIG